MKSLFSFLVRLTSVSLMIRFPQAMELEVSFLHHSIVLVDT